MSLASLPPLLARHPEIPGLAGARAAVVAVPEPARAYAVAGLAHLSGRQPIVVAVPTTAEAERLAHDLRAYLGGKAGGEGAGSAADDAAGGAADDAAGGAADDAAGGAADDVVEVFPAWETLPFERVSPAVETMGRRLRVMWRLRQPGRAPRVVVAPIRALVQRLGPHVEDVEPVIVRPGDRIDPLVLVARLVEAGYRREYQVEHRGEVARRGSIVDVFPSTADGPVRIDLWGDEVDRLTRFSVADQRSTGDVDCAEIFPARELLPTEEVRARASALIGAEPWGREQWERLAEGSMFDGMESWLPWLTEGEHVLLDLVGRNAQVVLVEPRRMRERAKELLEEEAALAGSLAATWGAAASPEGREWPRLSLPFDRLLSDTDAPAWTMVNVAEGPDTISLGATGWGPVLGDGERLGRQVGDLVGRGFTVVVAADGMGSASRIASVLAEQGAALPLESPWRGRRSAVTVEPLERGFVLADVKLAILTEADVTGRRRPHRQPRPRRTDAQGFFDDLQPGDFVVHHHHGVAKYGGMVKRSIGGAERDYLLLEYRGGDKLYVPSDQIDAVRHYTGGEAPSLHRLGGTDWQKTRARVKSAVQEIAQELVVLYQKRLQAPGHAFPHDTPWQRELEEAFPFQETPDQLKAIADVKADMEESRPMDRLVCGDVGFGKTEVAIRAAFKAVQDGKQVAILVPTTLLAQQHYTTFSERFAGYPVRVEVLSRFLTPAQAKAVSQGLADGSVDVVVGTHRLLSGDVTFKDLGLLVVDEEQRFGVSHKEAIKKLKANVDVLTLTATPIPRTLEMSLTGIRDLTLLNTPPAERQPILTYVGEYDERAATEAIRRELLREGQVFFVHNRVYDIEGVAARLRELVPEARIAVAHGQMDEALLERMVLDFWEGQYDVLVCTTIIESGIDMPTVNTLVVDRADLMGLGQLHQLRGRVGRAGQRAYAYLFFPPQRQLTEEAYERLKTIGEQTELGSGFKIAMRDLEIRGAGNLLGTGQSGHIAAVGYDLYVQMVNETMAELKGEPLKEPVEVRIDIPVDANLPPDYVAKSEPRLEAYRRLAAVMSQGEVDDIAAEWADRYGPPPPQAEALLRVARLRAEAVRTGVKEITVARDVARLQPLTLKTSQRIRLQRVARDAVYKEDIEQLVVPLKRGADPASALADLLAALVPEEAPPVLSAAP